MCKKEQVDWSKLYLYLVLNTIAHYDNDIIEYLDFTHRNYNRAEGRYTIGGKEIKLNRYDAWSINIKLKMFQQKKIKPLFNPN